jgi:glycerophosphoryl diester phosphodiesterase
MLAGLTAALLAALVAAPPATANVWLERRVMNIAHQGGEFEAPSSTYFSLRRSVQRGADMLEIDVHGTRDGNLAVIHDATVDRTTNGSGRVGEKTMAEIRRLDAAYWFVRGRNAVKGEPRSAYPFRGIRTGERPPPKGYRPGDFRILALAEVFRRFPKIPINIEIKGNADTDQASFNRNADLLASFMNRTRRSNVIVVSFNQAAVDRFHEQAPQVDIAPGITGVAGYFLAGVPPPEGTVAFQIPTQFNGLQVASRDFVARAHADGYAVHVFLDAPEEEKAAVYRELVDVCVDGIMTAFPTKLERFLDAEGLVRPGMAGADPCAASG